MWWNWLPWRYVIRRVARAHGILDPIALLSHLHRFAQPAEVAAPMELLRAGVLFHARGLINTGAIQHNLDWIWPFWVQRQFDPSDDAFIPRAFSITHVNLTHRNWTAVGLPDVDALPIVDPHGLVTPHWDGWSLEGWIVADDGRQLIPSTINGRNQSAASVEQRFELEPSPVVETHSHTNGLDLVSRADVIAQRGIAHCRTTLVATSDAPAWLVVALRPYNPEGVSFLREVQLASQSDGWLVNAADQVRFSEPCAGHKFSRYRDGDVDLRLLARSEAMSVHCDVGMATAAALFRMAPHERREVSVDVPLKADASADDRRSAQPARAVNVPTWHEALAGCCTISIPDARMQFLFDAALRTLVLHSPGDIYPGPYTYKRFWFRDAAFMLHALLCLGFESRAERVLARFPGRQAHNGYFRSQEGEWDSNGEALWILDRWRELTGRGPKPEWRHAIERGAEWIVRKRLADSLDAPHAGLLPAGFSAEHLGPNDYYYWDDFWSVAGLRSAAAMLEQLGDHSSPTKYRSEADRLMAAIERSLALAAPRLDQRAVPASPYRRMDAGAIGSLAVDYPLQLWAPGEPRLLETVRFLRENCFFRGGFFQDMIHSGVNAYLTLHVAQVMMRAGDPQAFALIQTVADLASPTGQWPEAIHPRTLGGCMGDGQHAWAAAEWLLALRACFVREEDDRLVVGAGIPEAWLSPNSPALRLGPTATRWGRVSVHIAPAAEAIEVRCDGPWHAAAPPIEVAFPGRPIIALDSATNRATIVRDVAAPLSAFGSRLAP
ncbi:MAG TPA: hypothetical protein VG713_09760 [Pirellulales bacterium]|nr:hypothetical protein [Pirellulales bacterium]